VVGWGYVLGWGGGGGGGGEPWRGCKTQRLLSLQKYLSHTGIVPAPGVLADGILGTNILDAFAKLRKVIVNFVMSVRMEQLFPLDGFS